MLNVQCTRITQTLGGLPTDIEPASSVLTERAMETIRQLRRELERCHADLQTDEELFAEKIEELNQLQSAYNQLVREKERLEEMWLAAQENEGTWKGKYCYQSSNIHVHHIHLHVLCLISMLIPSYKETETRLE